jgi:hypothetical protein
MIATAFVTSTRARQLQADHFVDEIIEIIDTETDPNRARVRMDGRKWVAAKQAPKKYGDKIDHTHGGDPDNPVITHINYNVVYPKTRPDVGS